MRDITPAQARVSLSNAAPLPSFLRPLLARPLDQVLASMQQLFPPLRYRKRQDLALVRSASSSSAAADAGSGQQHQQIEAEDDTVFQIGEITVQSFKFGSHAPLINRPRLLLCGADAHQGQPHGNFF